VSHFVGTVSQLPAFINQVPIRSSGCIGLVHLTLWPGLPEGPRLVIEGPIPHLEGTTTIIITVQQRLAIARRRLYRSKISAKQLWFEKSVGRHDWTELRPKFMALKLAGVGENGLSCSVRPSSTHHQDRARRNEEYKSNYRPQLTP
jgi:hypothetical protein